MQRNQDTGGHAEAWGRATASAAVSSSNKICRKQENTNAETGKLHLMRKLEISFQESSEAAKEYYGKFGSADGRIMLVNPAKNPRVQGSEVPKPRNLGLRIVILERSTTMGNRKMG